MIVGSKRKPAGRDFQAAGNAVLSQAIGGGDASSIPALIKQLGQLKEKGILTDEERWRLGFAGSEETAEGADNAEQVFYNQALNTFYNYGNRASVQLWRAFAPETKHYPISVDQKVISTPAGEAKASAEIWITDPPYADAIHYHEITEYFIAWLAKSPQAGKGERCLQGPQAAHRRRESEGVTRRRKCPAAIGKELKMARSFDDAQVEPSF